MNTGPELLVVGGDGLIGKALVSFLERDGRRPWKTTRRPGKLTERTITLDLTKAPTLPSTLHPVVTFICAGITSVEKCEISPQETQTINVDNTLKLVDVLIARGSQVVYLSTNMVFDGSKPGCKEYDA